MLAKFILLSLGLISVASYELLKNPSREEEIGSKLPRFPQGHEKLLKAHQPFEQEPWAWIKRLQSDVRTLFARNQVNLFPQPPGALRRNFFTSEKRLDTKKNWLKGKDQLKSLYTHSQELSALDSKLRYARSMLVALNIIHAIRFYQWSKNAVEGLTNLNKEIVFLKQVRLLELGIIDLPTSNSNLMGLAFSQVNHQSKMDPKVRRLPEDVVALSSKKVWKHLGESIVNEIKKIIFDDDNQLFGHPNRIIFSGWIVLLWWKHALTMIDFLFQNNFIEKNTVQNFFQDPKIVDKIIDYIALRLENDTGDSFMHGSSQFPKQWYWPLWHDCFKALSKKEEDLLCGHLLLQSRYQKIIHLMEKILPRATIWNNFFFSREFKFKPLEYLKLLRSNGKSLTSEAHDMLNRDVQMIIQLVTSQTRGFRNVTPYHHKIIMRYLYDILDFFEGCIFPGIIENNLYGNPKRQHFEDRHKLIKLHTQMDDLTRNAHQYFNYVKDKSPNDWFTSSSYKSNFDGQLNQLTQKFSEFKAESERVKQILQHQGKQSEIRNILKEEVSLQEKLNQLHKKSENFVAANLISSDT